MLMDGSEGSDSFGANRESEMGITPSSSGMTVGDSSLGVCVGIGPFIFNNTLSGGANFKSFFERYSGWEAFFGGCFCFRFGNALFGGDAARFHI